MKRRGSFDDGATDYVEIDQNIAYESVLKSWAKWMEENVDPNQTSVFFSSLAPSNMKYKQAKLHILTQFPLQYIALDSSKQLKNLYANATGTLPGITKMGSSVRTRLPRF